MDHESEVIKQQMEQTRSSLAEKLETLEEHVASKVLTTADAVTETVEAVKGAVEETVHSVSESVENVKETVKETFDLHRQMEQHPWLLLGAGSRSATLGAGCSKVGWARPPRRARLLLPLPPHPAGPTATAIRAAPGSDTSARPGTNCPRLWGRPSRSSRVWRWGPLPAWWGAWFSNPSPRRCGGTWNR